MEIILKTMLRLSYPSTARVIARSISRSAWGGLVKEETVYNILKRLPEVEKLPNGIYALNTEEYKNM